MHIRVNDGVRYYVDIRGEGKPIVLLHGFTGSGATWENVRSAWQEGYQTIAIDLLGHGLSDKPDHSSRYSIEQTHKDLIDIFNQLKLESICLVGYSMGGRVALSFALTYPEYVTKLILESSSPGLAAEEARAQRREADDRLAQQIEQNGLRWFVDYWSNIALFQTQKKLPLEVRQRVEQARLSNTITGLTNSLLGIGTGSQPSYWDKLEQFTIPTTLIVGECDEKFVYIGQQMVSQMINARLHVIADAGHHVHLEKPEPYVAALQEA